MKIVDRAVERGMKWFARDMIRQCEGRILSAAVVSSICTATHLPALRRVSSVKTDSRAMDLDRIAIDH